MVVLKSDTTIQKNKYIWEISNQRETGIRLVGLTNSHTGVLISTPVTEYESLMTMVGANFSRFSLSTVELLTRALLKKIDPKKVLEKLINPSEYGHSSVAELARTKLYFENLPDWLATKVLNCIALYAAQQRSTRYQGEFVNSQVISIFDKIETNLARENFDNLVVFDKSYQFQQRLAYTNSKKWIKIIEPILAKTFGIDPNNPKEVTTNKIRTLDITRGFLPFGVKTSFCLMLDTRVLAQLISLLKGSDNWEAVSLGEQIEELVNPSDEKSLEVIQEIEYIPELAELIKYTSGEEASGNCLKELKKYLEVIGIPAAFSSKWQGVCEQKARLLRSQSPEKTLLMKLIKQIYPSMDIRTIFKRIDYLTDDQKEDISEIIFRQYNHHKQMGQELGSSSYDILIEQSIGDMRDYNRHRAGTRFINVLGNHQDYQSLIDLGWIMPEYLKNPAFDQVREEFVSDVENYYSSLQSLIELSKDLSEILPKNWVVDLLLMCQKVESILSGDIKFFNYLASLRTGVGGRIDYRLITYYILEAIQSTNPLLKYLGYGIKKPDPLSPEEYLGRS